MPDAPQYSSSSQYVIVVGFGVPGRAVVELLTFSGVSYCVIEKNPETVHRCERGGEHIICGDATQEQTLRSAGIDRATLVVVAVPDQAVALEVTLVARSLNKTAKIVTRC